jgi:hypothetical protein
MEENNLDETEDTSRFKIVAERAYFWNFLVNVVIVFILILVTTLKPNNNSISNDTLTIILNFMVTTTYIFAGTYILKFLGKNGTEFMNKLGNVKNFITSNSQNKSRGKK